MYIHEVRGVGKGRIESEREEKFKLLEEIFRELGLPVRFKRVSADRWEAFLGKEFLCSFEVAYTGEAWTFGEWLAYNVARIFACVVEAEFWHILRRLSGRLGLSGEGIGEFLDKCHLYVIGGLGRKLVPLIDFIKKTEVEPKWLRGIGRLPFFVDHFFYSQGDVFVSEPYEMSLRDLKALIAFCESHGLDAKILGFSRWFPGRTFRVVVYPRGRASEDDSRGADEEL